ncbi:hypothetical protein [Nocardioides pantholopis]|uniref:hypothetical protein n=1 Tax=Nocardioides pantholopis TaxID=2483798 RepID=UPI000FD91D41|nr:hypothetical protein [Nocardioides pantholopis]
MLNLRRTTATVGAAVLLATPLVALSATPAQAADRNFRCSGARVDFDVERDDGRYEVAVDIDRASAGSRWRVTLRQNGKRFYHRVRVADREGDVEVDRNRPNTRGRDTFKLRVKRIGGAPACRSTIRVR